MTDGLTHRLGNIQTLDQQPILAQSSWILRFVLTYSRHNRNISTFSITKYWNNPTRYSIRTEGMNFYEVGVEIIKIGAWRKSGKHVSPKFCRLLQFVVNLGKFAIPFGRKSYTVRFPCELQRSSVTLCWLRWSNFCLFLVLIFTVTPSQFRCFAADI